MKTKKAQLSESTVKIIIILIIILIALTYSTSKLLEFKDNLLG